MQLAKYALVNLSALLLWSSAPAAPTDECTMLLVLTNGVPTFSSCSGSCDTGMCKSHGRVSQGAQILECRCGNQPSSALCAASLSTDGGVVTVNCDANGCVTPDTCVNTNLGEEPKAGCDCAAG